ncbi:hypothetical protein KKB3_01695 [Dehalococcoides mccartyi]|nr:hypothetical protein KKB3_01695 [Dehalococcoides mccartyi]
MTGIELITAERKRQIEVKGFDAKHDDGYYNASGELAFAAICYASPEPVYLLDSSRNSFEFFDPFPLEWDEKCDKRARVNGGYLGKLIPNGKQSTSQRIRNLVKAGALIAAEIDRLQRCYIQENEHE